MPLVYRTLADLIVVVHVVYVAFIIVGQLFILVGWLRNWSWTRHRWFRLAHVLAIAIVVLEAWCGVVCPLTTWEQQLRQLAGDATYRGAFLANAAHELLFVDVSQTNLTIAYSGFALLVLITLVFYPPRLRPLS